MTMSQMIEKYFLDCLKKNNGNRTHTAKQLDISVRTVRNWINKVNKSDRYKLSPFKSA